MRLSRRALVLGLPVAACSRRDPVPAVSAPPPPVPGDASVDLRGQVDVLEWTTSGVSTRAVILVPRWTPGRVPVLVALHGRGEAVKPPPMGAMGWAHDYALVAAIDRACHPPLTDEDYQGLSEPEPLAKVNEGLRQRPFGGVIVACPHLPDLDLSSDGDVTDFGRFLVETLLPRVRKETPASLATGIDGVSLGGHVALRVGLATPDVFGAVGALQAAIGEERVAALTEVARAARAKRPTMALRLTTSHDDYYAAANRALSAAWTKAGVTHDFNEVKGPHDYPFNRGPGAYEMLLWHVRVLRG